MSGVSAIGGKKKEFICYFFMGIEDTGLGRRVSDKDSRNLLREISEILGTTPDGFPGAQPVTLGREDIESLLTADYYVCEKSDGVRVLLYVKPLGKRAYVFLLDRTNTFVRVDKSMPLSAPMLLDGEMTRRSDGSYHFLVFDMLIFNGHSVTHQSLKHRLHAASKYLSGCSEASASGKEGVKRRKLEESDTPNQNDICDLENSPGFSISLKQMHKSYGLAEVYREIIPRLAHENDGLIFTKVEHAYQSGSCRAYLKWKPPHLNSVDFRLRVHGEIKGLFCLFVLVRQKEALFDFYWADPITKDIDVNREVRGGKKQKQAYREKIDYASLDGAIGEFSYKTEEYTVDPESLDLQQGRWSLLRIRKDKTLPNGYKTVISVMQSIKENVTYPELEDLTQKICTNWKRRRDPLPPK